MNKHMQCFVSGRVQGVLFRDFSRRLARSLNLYGTVENLSDGRVAIEAEGDEEKLLMMAEFLKKGSIFSRVDGVQCSFSSETGDFSDFRIIYKNFFDRL